PPSAPTAPLRLPGRAAAPSGGRLLPVRGDERAHALRRLRALAHPIVDPRQIELELRLPAMGDGIEVPHVLETGSALALAAVGHDDVIEGLISRPAPRQANGHHVSFRSRWLPERSRRRARGATRQVPRG